MGYKPTIQLYTLEETFKNKSYQECQILDGLQRTTSMLEFINNEFTVFNGLSYEEYQKNNLGMTLLSLEIFKFKTHEEACKFYIDINKGITHSEEDINRAYDFLNKTNKKISFKP